LLSAYSIIALGVTLWPMPGVKAGGSATAQACAKADLALMQKLEDDDGAAKERLAKAVMRMIEARRLCWAGDYARGLALYAEAEALTGSALLPSRKP
jgi:hypothetical protein